jgi:uncharacterized protein YndB with AHSA1/START domain
VTDDLRLTNAITIDAPVDEVWDALTTPARIKQWFFGVDTESDWQVGAPIIHRGTFQGKPYEDRGEILRFDPPKTLVHTHWSDVSGTEDRPENHQEVTWSLEEQSGATRLTVSERNLPSEDAKAMSEESWKMALDALKDLIEGRPAPLAGRGS